VESRTEIKRLTTTPASDKYSVPFLIRNRRAISALLTPL